MTFTNQTKNSSSLSLVSKNISATLWDELGIFWDGVLNWDSTHGLLISNQTKNTLTLTNVTKN